MGQQLEKILNRPVNLRGLIAKIAFNPDLLEKAALEQPGLYLEASRYRTLKMRKKARAFLQKDVVRAQLGLRYRRKKKDGKALTEGAVKDAALFDPEMIAAQEALDRANEEEEWAKGLVETFRQRLSVIKVVAEIRNAEIGSEIRAVRSEMAVGAMRKAAEKARERFRNDEVEEDDTE